MDVDVIWMDRFFFMSISESNNECDEKYSKIQFYVFWMVVRDSKIDKVIKYLNKMFKINIEPCFYTVGFYFMKLYVKIIITWYISTDRSIVVISFNRTWFLRHFQKARETFDILAAIKKTIWRLNFLQYSVIIKFHSSLIGKRLKFHIKYII